MMTVVAKYLIKVTDDDYSETLYEGREIMDHDAIQETRDMAWAWCHDEAL